MYNSETSLLTKKVKGNQAAIVLQKLAEILANLKKNLKKFTI